MKFEYVKDWMSTDVKTISPNATLPEAHSFMISEGIRRLPVVDKSGRLIGIVTLSDVQRVETSPATTLSVWELNYLLAKMQIKKIMTPSPITVTPETTIGEAARIMLDKKISGIPVLNKAGNLVGIITESDIFSMVVLREWQESDVDPVPA